MIASNMSIIATVQGISACIIDTIDGNIDMFLRIIDIPQKFVFEVFWIVSLRFIKG